jgi:hypothetical protein
MRPWFSDCTLNFAGMRGAHKAPLQPGVEAGSSPYARFESFPVDETGSWRIALDAIPSRSAEPVFFFNDLMKFRRQLNLAAQRAYQQAERRVASPGWEASDSTKPESDQDEIDQSDQACSYAGGDEHVVDTVAAGQFR